MKTKKLLSILLALMMMLSVVPMYASAAEPIALTTSNVVSYPTVKGTIYYGQIIGEELTLEGGEVQYNGMKVEGEFQFSDPTKRQTSIGNSIRSDIIFVPANSQDFTGFSERRSRNVTYQALKPTPVFSDSNNLPKVEGVVESGVTLSTITINGGQVMNPYYPEETNATSAKWEWADPTKVVIESGLYEAVINPINYESLTCNIQINVESPLAVTEISELPFIEEINYSSEQKWGQITINGGTVVVKDTDTVVEGVFAVTDLWKNVTPKAGSYEVDVIFTPNNTEAYTQVECKIPVTVNKGQMKFVDENGNEIVPEITVPYGTTFGDIHYYLESYVAGDDAVSIGMVGIENANKTLCETGTYTASLINRTDSNYERTEKEFKIIVEAKKLEPTVKSNTGYYVVDDSGTYNVEGTFDIYVDDELVHSGIKYLEDKFELTFPENVTATYTIKAVYNPVENDNYSIDDVIYQKNVIAKHGLTLKNGIANYKLGDDTVAKSITNETISIIEGAVVALEAVSEDFAEWIITDAKGNALDLDIKTVVTNVDENGGYTWETVDGDLSCENIIFTMPTEDVIITLRTTKDIAAENCDHICHSDNPLFQMLWKVLTFIFRLFDVQQYCDCGNLHYDAPLFG